MYYPPPPLGQLDAFDACLSAMGAQGGVAAGAALFRHPSASDPAHPAEPGVIAAASSAGRHRRNLSAIPEDRESALPRTLRQQQGAAALDHWSCTGSGRLDGMGRAGGTSLQQPRVSPSPPRSTTTCLQVGVCGDWVLAG